MKRLNLLLSIILIPTMIQAGIVTKQDALLKAKQFMPGKSFQQQEPTRHTSTREGETSSPAYYVFNANNNDGFVIVSADDRTEAILGYADNGFFDDTNMPSNVKAWFEYYEQSIRSLKDENTLTISEKPNRAKIAPLIETKWGQGNPYNLQCPMDSDILSLTGCVATALAQIMYYYKWPLSTTDEIPSYITTTKEDTLEALPPTTFKWELMKNEYNKNASGDSANAVAELMRYCGQLNEMDYTKDGSAAHIHRDRMVNLLGFSNNMRYVERSAFMNKEWEDNIYNDLVNKMPVLYRGSSFTKGGHQFICDGYDGNGLFHINWGWGGSYDGYFLLSLANPYGEGIGGSIGSQGFSYSQAAIIRCKPAAPNEQIIPRIQSYDVSVNISDYSRSSLEIDFKEVSLMGRIWPQYNVLPEQESSIETGWALYQNGIFIKCLDYDTRKIRFSNSGNTYLINNNMSISFGSDLENGRYQLRQIYKLSDETEWNLCDNYTTASLIADIEGTSMTIRIIDSKNDNYTIDKICYSEYPCVQQPVYITLDLTNIGETTQQSVYLWTRAKHSDTWKNETFAIVCLDPGETGSTILSYTPSKAGKFDIKITTSTGEVKGTDSISISDVEQTTIDGVVYSCLVDAQKATITSSYRDILPKSLVIPSTITLNERDYVVTDIGDKAFYNRHIDSLIISEGIKTIGNSAFRYCDGLKTLDLPSTLESIGDYAFGDCNNLSYVTVRNDNPFVISENSFDVRVWNNDENVYFYNPPSATLCVPIGTSATYQATDGWNRFSSILEGEVKKTTIDGITYEYLTGPKTATLIKGEPTTSELTLPALITVDGIDYAVTNIGESAFYNNDSIVNLTIPEGIISIGGSAFNYCTKLTKVELPSTLTEIKDNAFNYCNSLDTLSIPEGVKNIGNSAFKYCYGLKTLDLPSTLESIGDYAFGNCNNLSYVTVRNDNPFVISENSFDIRVWNNDENVYFYNPPSATLCVPIGTSATYQATDGWNRFSSILEGEVKKTTIDGFIYECFTGPKTATLIKGEPTTSELTLPALITVDGIDYAVTNIGESAFYNNKSIVNITIPEGIISIGSSAFEDCTKLTKVKLSSTLTEIKDNAFYYCNSLDTLSIPEGVKNIGNSAFKYCYGLKTLDLPSTLESIGDYAFGNCNNLSYVTVRNDNPFVISENSFDVREWNNDEKEYFNNPPSATLCVPIGTSATYQATDGWNRFKTILEGEIKQTTIDNLTYVYITGSKTATLIKGEPTTDELTLPALITVDGIDYAVTNIGESAFYNNKSIVNIIIPEGIRSIDKKAFMDCYKLKKIALPSTITEIGDYSFYTCFDIDTLIIPEGTTTIGSYAFQYCLSMEVIELPSTITMIDDYAFADCHNLKKVTATMNNPCAINENVFGLIYWEDEEAVIKPSKAALCVPKGLAGIYRESDGWSSFAVIAEPVIVTAQNYTIQYGDDIPAFNYTSEGVELNGTPRIICTATKSSPAGTYPIVITKGSVTNYNDTYIDGTLTITKAPLTITVNSLSIWQDDAFPVFNVTYQGFKNGEDSTVLTRLPVVTSDVTSTNIIGEYNITASGAKAKNYKISYIQGKLTIKERIPGDVTGNGSVDIQDATIAVNYILGEHSKKYAYYMADLNKDSLIDVFDITAIINVIFKRSNFMAPVRSSNRERGTSYNLSNYSSVTPSNRLDMIYLSSVPNTVSLGVDKSERFTSFQMDVETPKNAEILAVELTGSKETHIIQAEKISNDIFRVIALSMNNTPLADTNNEIVSLKFANTTSGEVTVHNVIFVTPDGDAYHLNGSGTTTLPITNDIDIEIIYDLYGRQIFKRSKDLDNGVYIINNKKVVIK